MGALAPISLYGDVMKEATNLTPVEMVEESAYNLAVMACIAGAVGGGLVILHMATFSYLFVGIVGISIVGIFGFSWLKRKRFGNRNYSLGERVKRIELMIGEPA